MAFMSRSRTPRVRPTPVPGTPALVRRGAAALILGGALGCGAASQPQPPQVVPPQPYEEYAEPPDSEEDRAVQPDELPPTPPQVAPPPPQVAPPPPPPPPQVRIHPDAPQTAPKSDLD